MKLIWAMLAAVILAATTTGCAPVYHMDTPQGFVRYEKKAGLAFITADGVRLRTRTERNYPKADLAFWADAMEKHLIARGFLLHAKRCFKTQAGKDGCTAEFVLPHGAEDWVMAETLYLHNDKLAIVEVTGPFDRYQRVAPELAKAYLTMSLP